MGNVAVVYWSGTGNTEAMARSVEESLNSAGAEVALFESSAFCAAEVANFDAFAFGCPACGAEELDEGEFAPMWESVKGELADKKVALFGSYGWGGGEWLETWKGDSEGVNIVASVACEGEPTDETFAELADMSKALI